MIGEIFTLLSNVFTFGLQFLDRIFDATGMWPVYLGGFTILAILRFIVLPMLMSSTGAEKKASRKSSEGGNKSDG